MKKRIAIIGSGIAGLVAGYLCREAGAEVKIIESRSRRGMDSHTYHLDVDGNNKRFVDIPLRVMSPDAWATVLEICKILNVKTYEVDTQVTCSWIDAKTWFKSNKLTFGSKSIPFTPLKYLMHKEAYKIIQGFIQLFLENPEIIDSNLTLKEYAEKKKMNSIFWKGLIYPLLTTISTSDEETLNQWPANQLLSLTKKIIFGSRLQRILGGTSALAKKLGEEQEWYYDSKVEKLLEKSEGIFLKTKNSEIGPFDYVICATQANQLNFLPENFDPEKKILNQFPYKSGTLWIHQDVRFMPQKRKDWSPIHYQMEKDFSKSMFTVWVNPIEPSISNYENIFQTWEPIFEPKSENVLKTIPMERAVVNISNRYLIKELEELHKDPSRKVFFCGSYAAPGVPLLESAAISAKKVVSFIGFEKSININLKKKRVEDSSKKFTDVAA